MYYIALTINARKTQGSRNMLQGIKKTRLQADNHEAYTLIPEHGSLFSTVEEVISKTFQSKVLQHYSRKKGTATQWNTAPTVIIISEIELKPQ